VGNAGGGLSSHHRIGKIGRSYFDFVAAETIVTYAFLA